MTRTVTLHAFVSAKGGVGKSTLATACASMLSERGPTMVVDADFTGTSLADGLDLCAPKVALRADGTMDLTAAPTGAHYSLDETRSLRRLRKSRNWRNYTDDPTPPPPYLNDLFAFRPQGDTQSDGRVDALLWRHADGGALRYLPSSSIHHDIDLALGWLHADPHDEWMRRLAWLLHTTLSQCPAVTDLVFDLPPGLFGFANATLSLLAAMARRDPMPEGFPGDELSRLATFQLRPFLVASQDQQDLTSAFEGYARMAGRVPNLLPLINRATEGREAVLRRLDRIFGTARGTGRLSPLDYRVQLVGEHRLSLGRVFLDGGLRLTAEVRADLDVLVG